MDFILYNKHQPLCAVILNTDGTIKKITEVYNEAYAPLGVNLHDRLSLYEWWKGRSIPGSRDGLSKFLSSFKISSSTLLPLKSFALSLSDQYWLKPAGAAVSWEQINFFTNSFSKDIGEAFFNPSAQKVDIDFMSPDNTSDGWLKKKWIISEGKRCLVKTGSGPYFQEPFNEAIASLLVQKLQLPGFVNYQLIEDDDQGYCSICENFITPATELISAYALHKAFAAKKQQAGFFEQLLTIGERLKIPALREALENMLVLDYLIANKDRHAGNFGFIRNVETLSYIGLAPVYDNGTSLWYDTPEALVGQTVIAQPFASSHEEQIKLVKNLQRFNFSALEGVAGELDSLLQKNIYISQKRRSKICQALNERIEVLKLYQRAAVHAEKAAFFKQLQLNTEPVFVYYRALAGAEAKRKYNPELDKKIFQLLLQDSFSLEQCKKILLNSPNLKNPRMVDLFIKNCC